MIKKRYESWGRYPAAANQHVQKLFRQPETLSGLKKEGTSLLAQGQGRSYGDCCLNNGGTLLDTSGMNRFIKFDTINGILECEAGMTIDEILKFIVPMGWFLPVVPGTKFVSVGGAIANDIHGKNHETAGTFGRHINRIELLRSSGEVCSCTVNDPLVAATIGGLGLTGLILKAEIRLKKIKSQYINAGYRKFAGTDDFFDMCADSQDYEYTVSWIDCMRTGATAGRGIFIRGNHADLPPLHAPEKRHGPSCITVPDNIPCLIFRPLVKCFNSVYYSRQKNNKVSVHYEPFFFPLDRINYWNRLYGKKGLLQYQFVIPDEAGHAVRSVIRTIADSGLAAPLAVMKTFGGISSPGLLSFPRKGVTLAVDFPFSPRLLGLLDRLDKIVAEHKGAVYPAKDARMSSASFKSFFPRVVDFVPYIDPAFSSGFSRRAGL